MGRFAWIPAAAGLLLGVVFLTVMDKAVPHLHLNAEQPEGPKSRLSRTMMMVTAVILHNIPEGMAVGVVFAGAAAGGSDMTLAAAFVLALGIAIQNFPEGAIISLPLKNAGMSRGQSVPVRFSVRGGRAGRRGSDDPADGSDYSGASLSAGLCRGSHAFCGSGRTDSGKLRRETFQSGNSGFAAGFVIMMILDVALG